MSSTAPALNAATERRYEETLERRRRKSDRRDLLGAVVLSASFTVAAIALAVLATPARDLNPLLALAFAAAYALAVRIEFTTGAHFAVPTQLVFVPMLLLLPTPLVPLLVAAAYVGSDLAAVIRDRLAVGRAVIAPADTWFAIWPALVLVLGDAQLPSWDLWALAVMTFELLTGAHPFAAVAVGLSSPAPAATTDLPAACQTFFASALAIDRAARPQSPAAFLEGLERSLC